MKKLMPHQIKVLKYAKPLSSLALFLEMRLGKTLITIRWIELKKVSRILVVCPKTVIPVWCEELYDEDYAEQDVFPLYGSTNSRLQTIVSQKCKGWFITNYESISYCPEIIEFPWDAIILDESTRIRKPKAGITKLLCTHTKHIPLRAILTGLPCPESEMDYCEQFRFLHEEFMQFKNYWYWRKKYCFQIGYSWQVKASILPKIKEYVNKYSFSLTRIQAGMGSKKVYVKRYVHLNPVQKRMYREMMKLFLTEYEGEVFSTKYIPVRLEYLIRIASGFTPKDKLISPAKGKEILYLLSSELKNEKVVIWFKHNLELEYIVKLLTKNKINVGWITGKSKSNLTSFKSKTGKMQVLCVQGKCGMMGLDFSVASTSIYYSNWWDGEIRRQSEDRIIHPRKKVPLLYIDLVCKGTVDEDILDTLKKKKLVSKYFTLNIKKLLTRKT